MPNTERDSGLSGQHDGERFSPATSPVPGSFTNRVSSSQGDNYGYDNSNYDYNNDASGSMTSGSWFNRNRDNTSGSLTSGSRFDHNRNRDASGPVTTFTCIPDKPVGVRAGNLPFGTPVRGVEKLSPNDHGDNIVHAGKLPPETMVVQAGNITAPLSRY